MRRSNPRLAWSAALLLVIGLVAAACGGDEPGSGGDGGDDPTTTAAAPSGVDYASLTGTLNGTGSSLQDAFHQTVDVEFAKRANSVTVSYARSGSPAGRQALADELVQFAGTDTLIEDEDLATFKGGDVLYFPTVATPITVSYNLPGVDGLRVSAETLAGILSAEITTWDADEIAADNPDAELPSTKIAVVHRSDGSGTTSNLTRFLESTAGPAWTLGSGETVPWPSTTRGAEGNSGVAAAISSTEGAVGYVDLPAALAAGLQVADVKNAAGRFIGATSESAGAALEGTALEEDLTYDPLNAPGDTAYPITSPTWIIVYAQQPDAAVADALAGYLTFILNEGQELAGPMGYARLPAPIVEAAIAQIARVTA